MAIKLNVRTEATSRITECSRKLIQEHRFQLAASIQTQQPDLLAFGFSFLVYFKLIISSIMQGCTGSESFKIVLVTLHFIAMPIPCVISPALGQTMWKPTMRSSSSLLTITLTYALLFPLPAYLLNYHSRGLNSVW